MSSSEWTTILDMFEARLQAQRDALAMGPAPIEDWAPPAADEALPAELLDRATVLLWQCRELEDELERALSETADSLDRLAEAPAPPAATPEPVYFDSRV